MSPEESPTREPARASERRRTEKRTGRQAKIALWSGIASLTTALLGIGFALYPLATDQLGVNVPEFRFGTYMGVDGDTWLGFWGAIAGAIIAAGAAIAVLFAQITHQADIADRDRSEQATQAKHDREHQAELARLDREFESTAQLHRALEELLNELEKHFVSSDPDSNWDSILDLTLLYENAVYRWGVNSGLSPQAQEEISRFFINARKYYLWGPKNMFIILFPEVAEVLRDAVINAFRGLTLTLDEKEALLRANANIFKNDIRPFCKRMIGMHETYSHGKMVFDPSELQRKSLRMDTPHPEPTRL